MATLVFIGSAVLGAQVSKIALTGTWESGDKILIDGGGKRFTYTTVSATKSAIATGLAAAWNALTEALYPEFSEVTALAASDDVNLTADVPGRAFTFSVSSTESNGAAADDQVIAFSTTTANSGPTDASSTDNYSGHALPVNGDTLIFDGATCNGDLLYNLNVLSGVTLASLKAMNKYSGKIGLPERNTDHSTPYDENRPTFLAVGATLADIDCNSGRIKIDFGSVQTTATVRAAASSSESTVPAVQLLGTHASNVLNVNGGTVGVAIQGGQVSTILTLRQAGGDLRCGSGVTLGTLQKSGGNATIESATTAVMNDAGDITIAGSGTQTAITNSGGTCYFNGSGTITAYTGNKQSTLNFDRWSVARIVTAATLNDQASVIDSNRTVTWSNPITVNGDNIGTRVKSRRSFTVTPT